MRSKFEGESAFDQITEEVERARIFKDFLKDLKVITYSLSSFIHNFIYVCAVLSKYLCGCGFNLTAIFRKTKQAVTLIFSV